MIDDDVKILVVDDESNNLEVVIRCFDNKPYKMLYAPNGHAGYEVAVKEQPALIIMDWAMPVMNGIDATLKLKANADTQDIPVIIATGVMTSSVDLQKALETRAVDYIRKPIDMQELCARVSSALLLGLSMKEIKEKNLEIQKLMESEKQLLTERLDLKERELTIQAVLSQGKHNLLNDIWADLSDLAKETGIRKSKKFRSLEKRITESLKENDSSQNFLIHFEKVHPMVLERLREPSYTLTSNELKLCSYIRLGMRNKEIADLFGIELGTVKSNINRLKKKIGLAKEDSLRKFISSL